MHIWWVEKDFTRFQEGHIISLHQVNGKSKEGAELNIGLRAYQCIIKTWKNHFELADSGGFKRCGLEKNLEIVKSQL